jgi:NAD(P)H-dependent FMN reductase
MARLHTVIASTRPGRVGPAVARWFHAVAEGHGGFATELVDLAELRLPVYDEPQHPRLERYEHAHTKAWSRSVRAADAFVFVVPEYNFGPTPALLNALDYLYNEWNYAVAGFVSYGGVSGGLRGVQMAKLTLTTLKIMPIPEQVTVAGVTQQLDAAGAFQPSEQHGRAAVAMLDELKRWSDALAPLRAERRG